MIVLRAMAIAFAALASMLSASSAWAGLPSVNGQLVESGKPVQNGVILIEGNYAISDKEGRFSIVSLPGSYAIVVTVPDRPGVRYEGNIDVGESDIVIDLSQLEQVLDTKAEDRWFVLVGTYATPAEARSDFDIAAAALPGSAFDVYLAGRGRFALATPATDESQAKAVTDRLINVGLKQAAPYTSSVWEAPLVSLQATPDTEIQEATVSALLRILEDEREEVRRSARFALAALGAPVVPRLIAAVGENNYRRDLGVVFALSQMASWTASPDDVRKIWRAGRGYNDEAIGSALDAAMQTLDRGAKLALLGFTGGESVQQFQLQTKELVPDGILGPATLRAVDSEFLRSLGSQ